MRQPAAILLLIALGACTTSLNPPAADPNLFPTAYKKEIVDTLVATLTDPTNVRKAFISDPALAQADNAQRYTACVRYDARDANYHYMGSSDHIAYFYAGHLNQLIDATKEQCGNATYKPFPELENICLGGGAKCL
jgi:hypothetical protein